MQLHKLLPLLLDNHAAAIVLTDAQLDAPGPHILYVNQAFEKMTGYSRKEVTGKSPRLLQRGDASKMKLLNFREALKAGQSARMILTNYRKNGEEYLCDVNVWPITDTAGRITNYLAVEREVPRQRGRPNLKTRHEEWWHKT
jgi:PAS domain S-box-containing protein